MSGVLGGKRNSSRSYVSKHHRSHSDGDAYLRFIIRLREQVTLKDTLQQLRVNTAALSKDIATRSNTQMASFNRNRRPRTIAPTVVGSHSQICYELGAALWTVVLLREMRRHHITKVLWRIKANCLSAKADQAILGSQQLKAVSKKKDDVVQQLELRLGRLLASQDSLCAAWAHTRAAKGAWEGVAELLKAYKKGIWEQTLTLEEPDVVWRTLQSSVATYELTLQINRRKRAWLAHHANLSAEYRTAVASAIVHWRAVYVHYALSKILSGTPPLQ